MILTTDYNGDKNDFIKRVTEELKGLSPKNFLSNWGHLNRDEITLELFNELFHKINVIEDTLEALNLASALVQALIVNKVITAAIHGVTKELGAYLWMWMDRETFCTVILKSITEHNDVFTTRDILTDLDEDYYYYKTLCEEFKVFHVEHVYFNYEMMLKWTLDLQQKHDFNFTPFVSAYQTKISN